MKKLLVAGALSIAVLAGLPVINEARAVAQADMTPQERMAYVTMAASSDLYEIQSGQLAGQRSQRPAVRQFGQMLVAHHTQTTQQLTAAARAAGVPVPAPALLPMHRRLLERLQQSGSGRMFDRVFQRQQVQAHQMALALHRNYARRGDAPALRTTAGATVPIIQQHLRQAQRLARR
jgi:putative membrane protein